MRVHHLAFRTRQLAKLVRFYRDVLGLVVVRERGSVWLEAGTTIVMIEAAEAGEPPIPRGSRELVAFGATPKALASLRERLKRRRIHIEGQTDFTFYFRDPDGRRVAVSCAKIHKRR